jgi:hypothetical protein
LFSWIGPSGRLIFGSITPVAAWRFDVSKGRQVDIDDGFERARCRAVLETVWECCEPVRRTQPAVRAMCRRRHANAGGGYVDRSGGVAG